MYFTGNTPHIKEPKTKAGIRRVVMLDSLSGKFVGNPNDYVFSFVYAGFQAFCTLRLLPVFCAFLQSKYTENTQ